MDGYISSTKTRKLPHDITSHTQVDKVTTFISAPAHAQLTEAAAVLTSLPKTKPKAAAHGRVLTSAENLKIIEDQQKEKELKKGQKQKNKLKSKETIVLLRTRQQVCQV